MVSHFGIVDEEGIHKLSENEKHEKEHRIMENHFREVGN